MPIKQFPPISYADEHGLLAVGGDLSPETLLTAYKQGIFPWPFPDGELAWFSPPERGIIPIPITKLGKTLKKHVKKNPYRFSFNKAFSEVVDSCQLEHRKDGIWLFQPLCDAYKELFKLGYAHSVEVWREERLVGGIFGVTIGNYFSGESMFHTEDNTSKLALYYLLEILNERKIPFLDCQVVTPTTESFGATLIRRDVFLGQVKKLVRM